jgi:hypothetical protein
MSTADLTKVVVAGTLATLVMSGVAAMAPMMGMPPMNPAAMLAGPMGGSLALGWVAHLMIGNVLAVLGAVAVRGFPGPRVLRFVGFAVGVWFMAQIVVMPMMGNGLFSGSALAAAGSLIGHVVYGAVLGLGLQVTGVDRGATSGLASAH